MGAYCAPSATRDDELKTDKCCYCSSYVTGELSLPSEDLVTGEVSLKFKQCEKDVTLLRPVGMRLGRDHMNEPLVVKAATDGGCASKNGVQVGWEIIAVNGSALSGSDISRTAAQQLERLICGPMDDHYIKMQSLLDVFDDFRPFVPLVALALENHSSPQGKANALAEKAAEIAKKKPEEAAALVPIIATNLQSVEPLSENTIKACKLVIKYIDWWKFQTDGETNAPPKLDDNEAAALSLTHAELNEIHTLAYIHFPHKFHCYPTFLGLTNALSRGVSKPLKPFALITVGPPGSGKSYMISSEHGMLNYLQNTFSGPSPSSYVEIDPDYWISNLCENDNQYRPLCNMLNLENFFFSINQRYNIIFGGTGKDVKNTCGRVTARLKQANYNIYYAIVLCTYEKCKERIKKRFEETGRDVPDFVVRDLFKGLQTAVPTYIKNQANLCDGLFIYENNVIGQKPTPHIVSEGNNIESALEIVNRVLALPPE